MHPEQVVAAARRQRRHHHTQGPRGPGADDTQRAAGEPPAGGAPGFRLGQQGEQRVLAVGRLQAHLPAVQVQAVRGRRQVAEGPVGGDQPRLAVDHRQGVAHRVPQGRGGIPLARRDIDRAQQAQGVRQVGPEAFQVATLGIAERPVAAQQGEKARTPLQGLGVQGDAVADRRVVQRRAPGRRVVRGRHGPGIEHGPQGLGRRVGQAMGDAGRPAAIGAPGPDGQDGGVSANHGGQLFQENWQAFGIQGGFIQRRGQLTQGLGIGHRSIARGRPALGLPSFE